MGDHRLTTKVVNDIHRDALRELPDSILYRKCGNCIHRGFMFKYGMMRFVMIQTKTYRFKKWIAKDIMSVSRYRVDDVVKYAREQCPHFSVERPADKEPSWERNVSAWDNMNPYQEPTVEELETEGKFEYLWWLGNCIGFEPKYFERRRKNWADERKYGDPDDYMNKGPTLLDEANVLLDLAGCPELIISNRFVCDQSREVMLEQVLDYIMVLYADTEDDYLASLYYELAGMNDMPEHPWKEDLIDSLITELDEPYMRHLRNINSAMAIDLIDAEQRAERVRRQAVHR